jgi:hypothetical protein
MEDRKRRQEELLNAAQLAEDGVSGNTGQTGNTSSAHNTKISR